MKNRVKTLLLLSLLLIGITAPLPALQRPLRIATTILPYKKFIASVSGEGLEIDVLIPPGANPHTFELTPNQLKKLAHTDMFVKVGSGIEFELVWTDKITQINKNMSICDSSTGVDIINNDPHIWLSPQNAQIIIQNITESLITIDPDNETIYVQNSKNYTDQLILLDKQLTLIFAAAKSRKFMVYHPAWAYFSKTYNLTQIPIEIDGKQPSPRQIAEIIETAQKYEIQTILIAPRDNPKTAQIIAEEINGSISYADPFAENYIENLINISGILSQKK
ncbi:MAG: zinc ABC transporter substrate-binding protein [bacterium]